jgi:hypothetical protein
MLKLRIIYAPKFEIKINMWKNPHACEKEVSSVCVE